MLLTIICSYVPHWFPAHPRSIFCNIRYALIFTGIVNERFDVSGWEYMFEITFNGDKHDFIENESRTTQSANERFF